jgi:hypothetical protein
MKELFVEIINNLKSIAKAILYEVGIFIRSFKSN